MSFLVNQCSRIKFVQTHADIYIYIINKKSCQSTSRPSLSGYRHLIILMYKDYKWNNPGPLLYSNLNQISGECQMRVEGPSATKTSYFSVIMEVSFTFFRTKSSTISVFYSRTLIWNIYPVDFWGCSDVLYGGHSESSRGNQWVPRGKSWLNFHVSFGRRRMSIDICLKSIPHLSSFPYSHIPIQNYFIVLLTYWDFVIACLSSTTAFTANLKISSGNLQLTPANQGSPRTRVKNVDFVCII